MSEMIRPSPGQEIGNQVARLRQIWVEAFNNGDVEQLVSFYAADAVVLPPNGAPAAIGRQAIRELAERMLRSGIRDLRVQSKQVEYTGALAIEIAEYDLRTSPGGNCANNEFGRLVSTWRRSDNGQFQITISVWSRRPED